MKLQTQYEAVRKSRVGRFLDHWVLPTVITVILRQLVLTVWRRFVVGVAAAAVVTAIATSGTGPRHTVEMYDTITLQTVPANPVAVAGYTSGYWPTYFPLKQRYPRIPVISIAINAFHHAQCLDVEPGDADPSQVGSWVLADIQAGFKKPCLYFSVSTRGAINYYLARSGIARSRVFLWGAHYVYHSGLEGDYDAIQWTDRSHNSNLDESTVTPAFIGLITVAPKPAIDHHYGWFPATPQTYGSKRFSERSAVQHYDRGHRDSVTRHELLLSSHRIYRIVSSDANQCAQYCLRQWHYRHRGFRFHVEHHDALSSRG